MMLTVKPTVNRSRKHHPYSRLVGLSVLYCCWDDDGNFVAPYRVTPADASNYEVHHLRGWADNSLRNLAVVTKPLHKKLSTGKLKRLRMPLGGQPMVPAEAC